jgi:hypothetical protein
MFPRLEWYFVGEAPMRRRPVASTPSILVKLASNAVMGVAMGLMLVLALNMLDQSGVVRLVNNGSDGAATSVVFVGTIITIFGVGSALTGLIFIMTDES